MCRAATNTDVWVSKVGCSLLWVYAQEWGGETLTNILHQHKMFLEWCWLLWPKYWQILVRRKQKQGRKKFIKLEASLGYVTTKLDFALIKQPNESLGECYLSILAFMISVSVSPCTVRLVSLLTSLPIEPMLDALAQMLKNLHILFSLKKVKGRELQCLWNLVWLAETSH